MKIERLVIENFKSIERIELEQPNPFTVFVGPNGSGKSNIFEALEFVNRCSKTLLTEAIREFGGAYKLQNRKNIDIGKNIDPKTFRFSIKFNLSTQSNNLIIHYIHSMSRGVFMEKNIVALNYENTLRSSDKAEPDILLQERQFFDQAGRIFVKNTDLNKFNYQDDELLNLAASNLEPVLKRILHNDILKAEIFEWLELFIPGFKAVVVDDRNELHWFEEAHGQNYFTKDLISDGTYNILALLTAVYQSDDKPQFLCIEEPENGLHPQVAGELVDFFRIMCQERGHYIWLNTHSQRMAARVRPEEFVVVEKKDGATVARQFRKEDFYGMRADEAWLTNALNGGLAW